MITKERFWHKPTYQSLRSSLVSMKNHMISNRVSSVSLPRIGCGLDQLKWKKVELILQEVFSNTGIQITVYTYKT